MMMMANDQSTMGTLLLWISTAASSAGWLLETLLLWISTAASSAGWWLVTLVLRISTAVSSAGWWFYQSVKPVLRYLFTGLALVRWFAFAMTITTLVLVNNSAFIAVKHKVKWEIRFAVLAPIILILPIFPRPWPLKEKLQLLCEKVWVRSLVYDLFKGLGGIGCFWGSYALGEFVGILNDIKMIQASVSFIFVLLALDLLYDYEDAIEVCDSFVLAGYGVMIHKDQKIVSQLIVQPICIVLCFVKTYLRSNIRWIWSKMEEDGPGNPTTNQAPNQANEDINLQGDKMVPPQ